ncbi:unnamed protein product [Owenia fusiformis]|uniref:Uncharacterized protein n=1 Tax=Owenia fusiformis TaxID=6347 RepID=A0A8J1XRB2_OWEFU|nr:unnamed protein product [Owenia fusiformis]
MCCFLVDLLAIIAVFSLTNGSLLDILPKGLKAKVEKNIRLPPVLVDDGCPSRFTHGSPHNNLLDDCHYYSCKQGNYTRERCPDGLRVDNRFKNIWTKRNKGQMSQPCTVYSQRCKLTLEEKGVWDLNTEICGIDVIWTIDISCSIELGDKLKVKSFIRGVMRKLPIRPGFMQVGGLTFSRDIAHIGYLGQYKNPTITRQKFKNYTVVPESCGTATYDALETARTIYLSTDKGRREDKKAVLLMVTDGFTHPASRQNETFHQAELLHKIPGLETFVIGLPNIKREGLEGTEEWVAIASKPENVFYLKTFDELKDIMNTIIRKSCETL